MAGEREKGFFIRIVKPYCRAHPAYGVLYYRIEMNDTVFCLIPFNLILRPLILFWWWIHYWPKRTYMERQIEEYIQWKRTSAYNQRCNDDVE